MLEYIFFHEQPYRLFMEWLQQQGVAAEGSHSTDGYEIRVPEEMEESLADRIDEKYDQLLELNQELVEEGNGEEVSDYQMSAILIELQDGTTTYADIDAALLGRIMTAVTPEEFSRVVEAVVAPWSSRNRSHTVRGSGSSELPSRWRRPDGL